MDEMGKFCCVDGSEMFHQRLSGRCCAICLVVCPGGIHHLADKEDVSIGCSLIELRDVNSLDQHRLKLNVLLILYYRHDLSFFVIRKEICMYMYTSSYILTNTKNIILPLFTYFLNLLMNKFILNSKFRL